MYLNSERALNPSSCFAIFFLARFIYIYFGLQPLQIYILCEDRGSAIGSMRRYHYLTQKFNINYVDMLA